MARETGIIPNALATRPSVRPECQQYLEAFFTLSASRSSNGYGLNPVTIGEIKDYALMLDLDREEALKLLRVVQAMDSSFLEYIAEKNKTS